MGLMKTIIIIALLIGAFAYIMPDQFSNVKDNILNKNNDAPTNIQKTPTYNNVGDLLPANENDENESDTNTNETIINETNQETPTPEQTEICDRTYSDYPDYYGTAKWGSGCSDAAEPQQECINSPPTRYSDSSQEINCCLNDGKCYWG